MDPIPVINFLPPKVALEALKAVYEPLLANPVHQLRYEAWIKRHIPNYADSLMAISVAAEAAPEIFDLEVIEELTGRYKDLLNDAIEVITAIHQSEIGGLDAASFYWDGDRLRNELLIETSYLYYIVSEDLEDVATRQRFTNIDAVAIADLSPALFWYEIPEEILIKLSSLVREVKIAAEDYLYNNDVKQKKITQLPFQKCFRDAILQLNRMLLQIANLAENDFWAVNPRYEGVDNNGTKATHVGTPPESTISSS